MSVSVGVSLGSETGFRSSAGRQANIVTAETKEWSEPRHSILFPVLGNRHPTQPDRDCVIVVGAPSCARSIHPLRNASMPPCRPEMPVIICVNYRMFWRAPHADLELMFPLRSCLGCWS